MRTSRAAVAPLLLVLLAVLAGCPPEPAFPRGERDELKVTRAVLYQNGIGYFERRGRVEGDVVKLRIRPEQIADILKSLTVVDLGDGRAVSVALPVEKGRARAARRSARAGAPLGRPRRPSPQAFRGARAEVATGEGDVAGRMVGVEQPRRRPRSAGRLAPDDDAWTRHAALVRAWPTSAASRSSTARSRSGSARRSTSRSTRARGSRWSWRCTSRASGRTTCW